MQQPSFDGLGPKDQAQLDAPKSEQFTNLKQTRQPPMRKYERQLAIGERYHSTLYKQRFPLTILIDIVRIFMNIINTLIPR